MSWKEDQEFIRLSWKLIEWKAAYYQPECVHPSRLSDVTATDDEYDAAEVRYLTLCRKLDKTNTVVHKPYPGFEDLITERAMVELDETRPSVQLAMRKLSTPK